jgi:ubiquinone/menaquinone biosynthesis C-methylase UbiE
MTLDRNRIKRFYDRFGSRQDSQAFYEDAALTELIAHADFEQARNVFELGCGTGRVALQLLQTVLPSSANYLGTDLSDTMLGLARLRLSGFADRAAVAMADRDMRFPLNDHSVDRVLSTYVFDLMSRQDIIQALQEARRVLRADGRLCLVSLTRGVDMASRVVSGMWAGVYHLNAALVGGCRPIRLLDYIDPSHWAINHHATVTRFGIPSEVLVAVPLPTADQESA